MCNYVSDTEKEEKPVFTKSQFKRMVMNGENQLVLSTVVMNLRYQIVFYPGDPVTICEIYNIDTHEIMGYGIANRHWYDELNPLIGLRQSLQSALKRVNAFGEKFDKDVRRHTWAFYFDNEKIWQTSLENHIKHLEEAEERKKCKREDRKTMKAILDAGSRESVQMAGPTDLLILVKKDHEVLHAATN